MCSSLYCCLPIFTLFSYISFPWRPSPVPVQFFHRYSDTSTLPACLAGNKKFQQGFVRRKHAKQHFNSVLAFPPAFREGDYVTILWKWRVSWKLLKPSCPMWDLGRPFSEALLRHLTGSPRTSHFFWIPVVNNWSRSESMTVLLHGL